MNFLLRNLFLIVAFLFLVLNGLFLFGDRILPFEIQAILQTYAVHIPVIAIGEIFILSMLAYFTSIKPVRSLKKEIAFFLMGSNQ